MRIDTQTRNAIATLRREAESAGDLAQAALCMLALGGPEALEGAEPGTECAILAERGTSQAEAIEECERVIAEAAAQRFTVRHLTGGPVVEDADGGVWHPSEELVDELAHLDGEELDAALVAACSTSPMRGEWRS